MVRLALVRPPLLTAHLLQVRLVLLLKAGGIPKNQMVPRVMPKTQDTPTCSSVFNARAGVTWLGSVLLQPKHKTKMVGTKGMQSNPLPTAVNKLATFPP